MPKFGVAFSNADTKTNRNCNLVPTQNPSQNKVRNTLNWFFHFAGKEKLNYPMEKPVYVVLEEDGTEVDEEEYFQTLPENTLLMLLYVGDKWSPYGLPFK